MPPALLFYQKNNYQTILSLLWFHTNDRIICSRFAKTIMGNFIAITLNLLIALGSMPILAVLIHFKSIEHLSICLDNFLFPLSLFYSSKHINISLIGQVYT